MLYAYARQYKDTDPINVTYVVSGTIRSRSGGNTVSHFMIINSTVDIFFIPIIILLQHHEICIVNESNLEGVILFIHVLMYIPNVYIIL